MSFQLLRTESVQNKQEICELEKELTETTKDLEQLSKENSEVRISFKIVFASILCDINTGTQCVQEATVESR